MFHKRRNCCLFRPWIYFICLKQSLVHSSYLLSEWMHECAPLCPLLLLGCCVQRLSSRHALEVLGPFGQHFVQVPAHSFIHIYSAFTMCWALSQTQDAWWAKPGQVPDFWALTGDTDIVRSSHRLLVKESHGKAFLLHAFSTGSKWPTCSFLLLSFENSLCILSMSPLLAMWFANNLSQSVMCLFIPLSASSVEQISLVLMRSNLSLFLPLWKWDDLFFFFLLVRHDMKLTISGRLAHSEHWATVTTV